MRSRKRDGSSKELIKQSLLRGESNKLIAARLNVKEKTVKWHLSALFKEAGVKSRLEYSMIVLNKEYTERLQTLENENETLKRTLKNLNEENETLRLEYSRAWLTIKNSNLKPVDLLPVGFKK